MKDANDVPACSGYYGEDGKGGQLRRLTRQYDGEDGWTVTFISTRCNAVREACPNRHEPPARSLAVQSQHQTCWYHLFCVVAWLVDRCFAGTSHLLSSQAGVTVKTWCAPALNNKKKPEKLSWVRGRPQQQQQEETLFATLLSPPCVCA
jgi:hypothetical protein